MLHSTWIRTRPCLLLLSVGLLQDELAPAGGYTSIRQNDATDFRLCQIQNDRLVTRRLMLRPCADKAKTDHRPADPASSVE